MANIGFGLETNRFAKEAGYDLFKSSLSETLGAVSKMLGYIIQFHLFIDCLF